MSFCNFSPRDTLAYGMTAYSQQSCHNMFQLDAMKLSSIHSFFFLSILSALLIGLSIILNHVIVLVISIVSILLITIILA